MKIKKRAISSVLMVLVLLIGIVGIGYNALADENKSGIGAISLKTDKGSTIVEGEKVTLTAEALGGGGNIEYLFYFIANGEYTVIQDYSSLNSATWVPNFQGYARISVEVRDKSGNKKSAGIDALISGYVSSVKAESLTADKVSPQPQGASIKLAATASGGKGTLKYRFSVVGNGTYKIIRDYSETNTATWTPDVPGYTRILVTVKDEAGVESTKEMDYTVSSAAEELKANSLTTDKKSPQDVGTEIVLIGDACGGYGDLQYEFVATNGSSKTVIQQYSSDSSTTWIPKLEGSYNLSMKVRDELGNEATSSIVYSINKKIVVPTSISLNSSSKTLVVGKTTALTATISPSDATDKNVTWTTSNSSVATVSSSGIVTAKAAGTATITATTNSGNKKVTCTVTVKAPTVTSIKLSHTSATFATGKTFYNKATVTPSNETIVWTTSNSSVATVENGFIYGVSAGTATITAADETGTIKATCKVTITEAEPIRFCYSTPNDAALNTTVQLVAITDKTRTAVKFDVVINGSTKTVEATSKTTDGNTYVWTAPLKMTSAGTFNFKAYSKKGNTWSTCSAGSGDIFVNSTTNLQTPTCTAKRASDSIISMIGSYEGFVGKVYLDKIANNIPTIGYGRVIYAGDSFYNNITQKEGYAMLLNTINKGSYTTRVNAVLVNNKVKFNQQQFDALVSFSYNIGTAWTYDFGLLDILLSSYESTTTVSLTEGLKARVTSTTGLNVRSSATTSSSIKTTLAYGATVTIVDKKKYNSIWYKVKTSSGTTGYCSSEYLSITSTGVVKVNDWLNMRSGAGTSYSVIKKLTNGTSVTILDITSDGWFKVKTSDGKTGYCSSSYIGVKVSSGTTNTLNLNNVNQSALISKFSEYHHAGGKCYTSLLYRRYDELEVFLYGDYSRDGSKNKHGFSKPSCMG